MTRYKDKEESKARWRTALVGMFSERSRHKPESPVTTITFEQACECADIRVLFRQIRNANHLISQNPYNIKNITSDVRYAEFLATREEADLLEPLRNFESSKLSESIYALVRSGCLEGESIVRKVLYVALSNDPETIQNYKELPTSYLVATVQGLYQKADNND